MTITSQFEVAGVDKLEPLSRQCLSERRIVIKFCSDTALSLPYNQYRLMAGYGSTLETTYKVTVYRVKSLIK